MSALSIEQVRAWHPGALDTAATGLGQAHTAVEAETKSITSTMDEARGGWTGPASDAAGERAAGEARTGYHLADALETARTALSTGAAEIGHSRTHLLQVISGAEAEGFTVGADGAVTARTLPPVMSTPEGAADAMAARNTAQGKLNDEATQIAGDITRALQQVSEADGRTAGRLTGIDIPQSLESAVKAYLERAWASKDLIGALGATAAGGLSLVQTLKNSFKLFGKSKALLSFLKSSSAPISDYATFLKNMGAADDAIAEFMKGKANGGFARFLVGAKQAKILGKVFLPLTVLTGAMDAITGGGYDGARGWATRGFGAAGAVGAGALLAYGAGLIALGPVGLGIAGAAVLGYGAWSAGNYIWDHRQQIADFTKCAANWVGDTASDAYHATTDAVSDATDWAGDKLSDAADTAKDAGKSALDTVSFGLL
ncbi:hypothetical protein BH10ACT10_BH10ACT10_14610 [soil metagenome]